MNQDPSGGYLETKVFTASREQLLLMLFDGAIAFSEQAKVKIEEKDIEGSYHLLLRAQRILLELVSALDRKIGEDLYRNLVGLYLFCYRKLVEANIKKDLALVDDALRILSHLRDTWREAVAKAREETGGEPLVPGGVRPGGGGINLEG